MLPICYTAPRHPAGGEVGPLNRPAPGPHCASHASSNARTCGSAHSTQHSAVRLPRPKLAPSRRPWNCCFKIAGWGVLFSQFSSPHPGAVLSPRRTDRHGAMGCPVQQPGMPQQRPLRHHLAGAHSDCEIREAMADSVSSDPPAATCSSSGGGQVGRSATWDGVQCGVVGANSATALGNAAGGCGCKCHLPVTCTHQEVSKHQACKPRPSTQSMPSGAETEHAQQHTWLRVSAGLRPWPIVTTAITAMTPPTTSSPAGGRRQREAAGWEARHGLRLRSRLSGLGPVAAPARPRGCTAAGRGTCATCPGRQQRAPAQPPVVVRTLLMLTLLAAQALPRCPVRGRRRGVQLARLHSKDVALACEAQGGMGA